MGQNMLRIGYYSALNSVSVDMDIDTDAKHSEDINHRPDPHHLRHCFDYLRQSIMCDADTNLEPVSMKLGGVTGWKYQRTCRDYEKVKEWAERWRKEDDLVVTANGE